MTYGSARVTILSDNTNTWSLKDKSCPFDACKLNILGWDLQVGWWLQYISVTRLISWYNISHVLKVYFILLQRFRLVIMSDHSSEPILVSHCPMTNFLFAVLWCSAVFVGNIESSYFGSYRSPNDPVSRSWHECWYYRISGHLWIKPLTLMNRTKTQTNEKTKRKKNKTKQAAGGSLHSRFWHVVFSWRLLGS